jgi:hypothetical protein
MDALARIEPVARPLLRDVDTALAALGAPAEHSIWALLRRSGATPADAVAHFAGVDASPLRSAAAALREQVTVYQLTSVAAQVPWRGSTGDVYAAQASALNEHLRGDRDESMAARLDATASYVEELAAWVDQSRRELAAALADVITSAQAVTLGRSGPAPAPASALAASAPAPASTDLRPDAVLAAADIGAYVLAAVAEAVDHGHALNSRWGSRLSELQFRAPVTTQPDRPDATIRLQH